ncbi:4'-phosphopantetheinyl transferase superfamily protein [Streptacidiphilus sp. EB129]|uniref:4'-phosphopantetheinyl transferase family protein n=1 Tax=Streptacidiphilus sp. EB129 TaxID=3156262 RepID=UPI003514E1CF
MTRAPDTAPRSYPFVVPAAGAVDLWFAREPALGPPAVLDQGERERAAAFIRDADRDRYVGAHVMLRHLLGRYLAVPPEAVRLARDRCPCCGADGHGRPIVAPGTYREPLHFSLSHAGSLVALAVGSDPVGADVEAWPRPEAVRDLVPALHPAEQDELAEEAGGEGEVAAFSRLWTRKEAYLKGLGTGLGRAPHLDYVGTRRPGPEDWSLADVPVPEGYSAAVALRHPGRIDPRVTWLDAPP